MFKKTVALVTAICTAWISLVPTGSAWAAEKDKGEEQATEDGPQVVRTILPWGDEGWAVVDVRRVTGTLVVVSPLVGREIDLEESNRFALFQGRTVFNQRIRLSLFDLAIPGFQSAVFLRKSNGKPAVKVSFRSGPRVQERALPLKDDDEVRRIREYIEHFSEIQKREYKIGTASQIKEDAEYPQYTDEEISFEQRSPRFRLMMRTPAQVVLKTGEEQEGELVPGFDDGRIMMQTGLDTRRIAVEEIERLRLIGDRGARAMETAFLSAVGGAATGALAGALAAWQSGASVKSWAAFGAVFFGAAGFLTGLVTGARTGRGGQEYVLGPIPEGKGGKRDRGDEELNQK